MKRETYMLEVKMKNGGIEVFPDAKWNFDTQEVEVFDSKKDITRNIAFDEVEWFRKK